MNGNGARAQLNGTAARAGPAVPRRIQHQQQQQQRLRPGEPPRQRRGDREVLLRRRRGQRQPAVPLAVRAAAGGQHRRHQQPLHRGGVPREPVHQGGVRRRRDLPAPLRRDLEQSRQHTRTLPGATSSYAQRWTGRLDSPIRTFGWSLDASANNTKFTNQRPAVTNEIVRGYLNYRPDPQVLLYGIGGYEWNNYYLTAVEQRRLRRRRRVAADRAHQRQGQLAASLLRRGVPRRGDAPQPVLRLRRQRVAEHQHLPAAALRRAGRGRRRRAGERRVHDPHSGPGAACAGGRRLSSRRAACPTTLQSPLNYYVQQVFLYEQQSATFTLLGVRNSTAFTLYNRKQEVISGGTGVALPAPFGALNNNTQRGGAVTFSHRLTPLTDAERDRDALSDDRHGAVHRRIDDEFVPAVGQPAAQPEDRRLHRRNLYRLQFERHERLHRLHGVRRPQPPILSERASDVRSLLRAGGEALPAQSGSGVLLREPRPRARVRVPAVRALPERGFHRRDRRHRCRQDHARAEPPEAARHDEGRRGADRHHAARRGGPAEGGRRDVRRAVAQHRQGAAPRQSRGVLRLARPRAQARPAGRGRGAEPHRARGRGAAHALELPARQSRAPAELSRRPAGAAPGAAQRPAAAAAAARDRVVPPRADGRAGDARLRRAPPQARRLEGRPGVRRGRARCHPRRVRRHPAAGQPRLQSRDARGLPRREAPDRRRRRAGDRERDPARARSRDDHEPDGSGRLRCRGRSRPICRCRSASSAPPSPRSPGSRNGSRASSGSSIPPSASCTRSSSASSRARTRGRAERHTDGRESRDARAGALRRRRAAELHEDGAAARGVRARTQASRGRCSSTPASTTTRR